MNTKTQHRGFVLSFAILVIALFILVYAQLQSEQLRGLRLNAAQTWNQTLPSRFALDARLDLNTLLDQRLRMEQNATNVNVWLSGSLPSPLSLQTNLLRYQTQLVSLGRDFNLYAFLDLNGIMADGNMVGRTDTNLTWKQNLNTSALVFYPGNTISNPNRVDINIYADKNYSSVNAWSLDGSGDAYVKLKYTDQNTNHTITSEGWFTFAGTKTYSWVFENGASQLTLTVGRVNGNNGSLFLDNNHAASLNVSYAVQWNMDANTSSTRAGYDWPLTARGKDANVVQTTEWVYE